MPRHHLYKEEDRHDMGRVFHDIGVLCLYSLFQHLSREQITVGDGELKMTATILFEDFEEEIVLIRDRESFEEEYCMVGAVCRHVKIPLVLYILEKRGNVVNLHRLFLQVQKPYLLKQHLLQFWY